MNYLVIDTECSGAIKNKAHPFDPENKLLLLGERGPDFRRISSRDDLLSNDGAALLDLEHRLRNAGFLVGFNLKFDLHWLRTLDISFKGINIWDCQLAEFILENQKKTYPSLQEACRKYALPSKKDTISLYLDIGLDVSDIPLQELTEYLEADLISTEALFEVQLSLIKERGYWDLFRLQCQDLLILEEMEYNGIKFDHNRAQELAQVCRNREAEICEKLSSFFHNTPFVINWASTDHLSAILYGGLISYTIKEPIGFYKTGAKAGLPKFKNVDMVYKFQRLVEPREQDRLKKDGFWSTAEDVLRELPAKGVAKDIIECVLELSSLQKLSGTYYEGIPKKFELYGWKDGIMHGQINQCVAITGRTSSSNPNLQNIPSEVKECFVSRYNDENITQ